MQKRAAIFIGLNVIRLLSIIGLILVFSSSIVVLVMDIKAIQNAGQPRILDPALNGTDAEYVDCLEYLEGSTVPNQAAGPFWAIVNRFLIIFEIITLFLSECGWPSKFFATYFPVLGPDFGVGALGIFECLIGAAILSHHVPSFALVSAFFLFSVGCLNILAGLIFRESSRTRRSLTEWHDSKKPILPTQMSSGASSFISQAEKAYLPHGQVPIHSAHPTGNSLSSAVNDGTPVADAFRNYGWGRQAAGEKPPALRGFLISRPVEATLPKYVPRPGTPASQQEHDD